MPAPMILRGDQLDLEQHCLQTGAAGPKKKYPSGRPGRVDFPFGQVTFFPSLPDRQGPRQAVR